MNRLTSILIWLGGSLAVICLLPFGLLWHQFDLDQQQRNQQILNARLLNARAAAQSLAARIASTSRTLTTLGNVPAIYRETNSEKTRNLLRYAAKTEPGVLGLDLVIRDVRGSTLAAGVRNERLSEAVVSALFSDQGQPVTIASIDGRSLVGISVETSLSGVWLLATLVGQDAWLDPDVLGAHQPTQVLLAHGQTGSILSGPTGAPADLPSSLRLPELSTTGRSLSLLAQWPDIGAGISAVAPIMGTDLQVVSRQPASGKEFAGDHGDVPKGLPVVFSVVAAMLFCVIPIKVIRPIWLLVHDARQRSGDPDSEPAALNDPHEKPAVINDSHGNINDQPTQKWTTDD